MPKLSSRPMGAVCRANQRIDSPCQVSNIIILQLRKNDYVRPLCCSELLPALPGVSLLSLLIATSALWRVLIEKN